MKITQPQALTNAELTAEVARLAVGERQATVALIVHLAEFDARRLYEGAGFHSLFDYCQAVLHLSEDAIYNRIEAARAARDYPVVVDMLWAGTLSPTTARMVRRHLTPENHEALLAAAAGLGKRAVEHLLARWFPQADVAPSVRKLPEPWACPSDIVTPPEVIVPPGGGRGDATPAWLDLGNDVGPLPSEVPHPAVDGGLMSAVRGPRRDHVRPLAPERYEIRFTATAATREKLREAQDLLSHAIPRGDVAEVVDRALTVLIEQLKRKKYGATTRPRARRAERGPSATNVTTGATLHASEETTTGTPVERPSPVPSVQGTNDLHRAGTDDVSLAAVKRAVWQRDGGRCAFVAGGGRLCGATRLLEFHHVRPRAAGGSFTVENIALRCRAHNGHEVDLFFGPGVRKTRGGRADGALGRADGALGTAVAMASARGRSGTSDPSRFARAVDG